jgi:hypothetical protein
MNKKIALSFAMAAVALMSGCFGGGGDEAPMPAPPPPVPAPPPPADPLAAVPDSARQSTDGMVAYLKTLSANTSDTRDPLELNGLALPQSDTADPTPL